MAFLIFCGAGPTQASESVHRRHDGMVARRVSRTSRQAGGDAGGCV
jgi:hypothetical protein